MLHLNLSYIMFGLKKKKWVRESKNNYILYIFTESVQLGRFGLVAISLAIYPCILYPSHAIFLCLLLALKPHDQFEASH